MDTLRISLMQQNDINQSARLLSIAMLNNPIHTRVFLGQGEEQRLEIEKMFAELLETRPGVVFLARDNETLVGVMRMNSCVGTAVAEPDGGDDEHDIGWRKSLLFAEWAKHDPVEQHWHLGPIGVLPDHQGSGIGSLLLDRFCREVDICKAHAYLETDLDKNVRLYERFGFRILSESEIFGVRNRYMIRESQT